MAKYDSYKETCIQWIGQIPSHWQIMPFKRRMSLNNGADYKDIASEDGYPVMGSGGQFAFAEKYMYDGEAVLLGRKGTIDRPLYFNGPFWAVDTMFYAVPDKRVCCKYMYYQALTFPFSYYATSTALPSMTQTDLGGNPICVPPVLEQKAIADYLDAECKKIDDLISKEEYRRGLLLELRKTIVTSMVTKGLDNSEEMIDSHIKSIGAIPKYWKVCQIRHVLVYGKDGIKIGPFGSSLTGKVSADGEYKIYGQWNIIDNDFSAGTAYVEEDTFSDLVSYQVISGDVLISMMGTVGKCAIIPDNIQKGIMDSHVVKAKLNPAKMDKDYFALVYDKDNSDVVFAQISEVKKGSIMDGLNSSLIKSLRICVPPIDEQREIVTAVKKQTRSIDSALKKAEKQTKLLKEYKTALIKEVVTGKRKVY